jgi:UDP-N-acetylglucosamine 2-epimerase (non-hydrolysing)
VGTDYDTIVNSVTTLLEDNNAYLQMSLAINPYGDGKACERIVTRLRTI